MRVKMMAFLKSAPGLAREDFVAYYETHHVPLIREVMPGILDYRRTYLPVTTRDIDVVTELWFAHQQAFEQAMAAVSTAGVAERIARDEERFLDRSATVVVVADERGGAVC
jgi:uncharacterized protein (TIGR02118 family)